MTLYTPKKTIHTSKLLTHMCPSTNKQHMFYALDCILVKIDAVRQFINKTNSTHTMKLI